MNQRELDPQPVPEYRKLTRKEITARYREKHREKLRADGRAYVRRLWSEDPEKQRALATSRRQKNRQGINEYEKQRRTSSQDAIEASRQACRKWHANNVDREHERRRKYDREHPERLRAAARKRRAVAYKAKGKHTETEIQDLLARQGNKCADCKKAFTPRLKPTLDHVTPLTRGGTENIDNLRWTCQFCNSAKYNKSPEEWAARKGVLFI